MIWLHCGDKTEVATTCSLVTRIAEDCDASDILITAPFDDPDAFHATPVGTNIAQAPVETPPKINAFLEKWEPQSLIWVGGALRPAVLRSVERTKCPATFINARSAGLFSNASGWLPGATRGAVAAFQLILTADTATATRLSRGGVARAKIETTGPITEEPMPLPHDQYELTVMAEALETRPVWFAADVLAREVEHMATAHLGASRKSHRLLLVITPRDLQSGPDVAQILRDRGLKVGLRSEGDDPDPEQQAYVADRPDELGLWYRLIPLTFVGGTLAGGAAASPLDPVLLGSAIVHGPQKKPHQDRFARLARVKACHEVRSAAELTIALGTLIYPEHAARLALAGWEDMTANAQVLNRLVAMALGEDVTP